MLSRLTKLAAIATFLVAAPGVCTANVLDIVNSLRAEGCGRSPAIDARMHWQPQLEEAARRLADGEPAKTAIAASGYHAKASAWITVRTTADSDGISRILERRYCSIVADAKLQEIGTFHRGDVTWIVLATPFADPGMAESENAATRVVGLINDARAEARRCGLRKYAATTPLTQSAALDRAALAHAKDLAASGRLGHRGSDGSMPADRVERAGYPWLAVAENVAGGQATPEEVVKTWLDSSGHCKNLMRPRYRETGVAYVVEPGSDRGSYWVQVFAVPLTGDP